MTFSLTAQTERAAQLLAAGQSLAKVAKAIGVDKRTITNWNRRPEFLARREYHRKLWEATIVKHGLALRDNRVAAKRKRWRAVQRNLKKRAGDPTKGGVEWDDSGLLVRRERVLKTGEGPLATWERIEEYRLDTAALRALNELEEGIAVEMGDRKTRVEHSGKIGAELTASPEAILLAKALLPDELAELKRKLQAAAGTAAAPEPDLPAAAP